MNKGFLSVVFLLCVAGLASSQTVEFCEKGFLCWADGSNGKASTTLKLHVSGGNVEAIVPPGVTSYKFVEAIAPLERTDWICAQGRHVYPDGRLSPWYVSETEGICNQLAAVMPPIEPPPPFEPPPPVVPSAALKNVQNTGTVLTFEYLPADCPGGVTKATKTVKGVKIVTLTCVK